MGSFSIWHWLIVMVVVLLLFGGGGKIPRIMADLARGIKAFKDGMKEPETATASAKPTPSESGPQKAIDVDAEPVMAPLNQDSKQGESLKG
jgi:sec-independent protein translocase protein TatA